MGDDITVTPKNSPVPQVPDKLEETSQDFPTTISEVSDSIAKIEIAHALGITDTANSRFETVYEYLTKEGKTKGEVLNHIRSLETKLGMPRYGLGESRFGILYNYIRSEKALDSAAKVRNSYLA